MPGFINKYPYTDFHELNLDWLLDHYKGLVSQLDYINTWISQHKIDYEDALNRLTIVESEINDFESQINAAFDQLKIDNQKQLDDALANINSEVDAKIAQFTIDVNNAIDSLNSDFETLRLQILNELTSFKTQINREIINLRSLIEGNNQYIFAWVDNRIQEFIDSLPEILSVYVYNPFRGEVTDIQTAINDLYSLSCIWGLTALQYDLLGLTATEYDSYELTAAEYDTLAYQLLYKNPDVYMMSPFTGEYTLVKNVVEKLCYFHMEGLTAEEYDLKDLTADDYDALSITAFDYDWFGEQLIA